MPAHLYGFTICIANGAEDGSRATARCWPRWTARGTTGTARTARSGCTGLACNHSAPDHAFRDGVARTERVASHAEINQWAEGTCARCGTQTLVTGRKLCVYCDQLRVMPPLPPERRRRAAAPARLALPPAAFLVLTGVAVAIIIIYLLMLR
jgi:hypothetical protein